MTGFNDEALNAMLEKLSADNEKADMALAKEVFNLALTYDVDFMVKSGVIKDGEFTDAYYDEDDAFDFIIDRISNAKPELDSDSVAEMLELYIEYHDAYMEEIGLLEWE
ncbi:MAG: hypothetical protein IKB86_01575 [Clostridia bacterium]|nr:hypothetical protein [Clostridia bacterium]